ncbi:MAG: DNA polymerase I [Nitrospirae bacterium GWB2_47_37]|nr:MAG: DNA polymerase I [Nitrospirae bacterium GWA2_46_11]OGW24598.1 MAG: DNA polymerase I [Nitrospirae bacterium GWB2_47_37]
MSRQYSLFEDKAKDNKQESIGEEKTEDAASNPVPIAHSPSPLTELSFDIEATGKDPISDTIIGIALCREEGKAYYVPIRHNHGANISDALSILKETLEDKSISKIGHNLKYDILILRQEGIHVKGKLYDTMLAAYLLNPNKPDHSLENVGLEYLMHKKRPFTEVLGKLHSFAEVPLDEATQYAAEDAALAMELKNIIFEKLKNEGLDDLYFNIEMPLIYVLAGMEEEGVRINKERLEELSKELEREIGIIESRIYAGAGESFNINSPKQLQKILFEKLGLKPLKKTKTGYSTGMDVLEELSKVHELPMEILNYRTFYKLKTTYVDALPKLIDKKTGRVHTSFNQTVTATGRLSSSEPNLQNIPVRGDWGTKVREVFTADEGCMLISADYSQIELRILAHMSNDEGLIDAFKKDIDIHSRTASELFGIEREAVTDDMRRVAKTVNFGVVYGISPFGLSEALNIPPKEAAAFIEQYFDKHPGVKQYMENTIKTAQQQSYVATIMGRKRPTPEINSHNANIRQQAERLAINTPVQGTAADLIKIAMINIWDRLKGKNLKTKMVLQIHDELLFEAPEDEIEIARELIKHEMENAMTLSVPLKVDIGHGKNWSEAH